jgi:hypothetical protein
MLHGFGWLGRCAARTVFLPDAAVRAVPVAVRQLLNLAPRARCRSATPALIVILAWCGMSPSVSCMKLHELSIVTLHSARALLSSLASPKDVVGRVFNADRPDQTDGVRYWFTSPVRSETRQIRISNQIPYTDRLNRYIGPVRPVSNRLNKKTELVDNLTCFHI